MAHVAPEKLLSLNSGLLTLTNPLIPGTQHNTWTLASCSFLLQQEQAKEPQIKQSQVFSVAAMTEVLWSNIMEVTEVALDVPVEGPHERTS